MTTTTAPNLLTDLTVVGPNLDNGMTPHGETFAVHLAGCKHLTQKRYRGHTRWNCAYATEAEVVLDIYADIIAEREADDGPTSYDEFTTDVHFAPCADLPAGDLADLLAEPEAAVDATAQADTTPAGPTLRPTRFRAYRRSQDLIAEAHFLADTPGATPVRIHIRRNAYDRQSCAFAEYPGGATLLTEDPMALELARYTYATAPQPAALEAVARRDVLRMAWDVAEVLGATLHPDTDDLLEGK